MWEIERQNPGTLESNYRKLRKRNRETGENNLISTTGRGKPHYTQGDNIRKMATFL